MTDSHCSLQEIPIWSYAPDSYKVRSGPGLSGIRVAKSWNLNTDNWNLQFLTTCCQKKRKGMNMDYFLSLSRYFSTMSFMASSKRLPKDLSVSTARCFKSLIRSESILVENTFFLAIICIIHLYWTNHNKDNQYELIKEISNYIKNLLKKTVSIYNPEDQLKIRYSQISFRSIF